MCYTILSFVCSLFLAGCWFLAFGGELDCCERNGFLVFIYSSLNRYFLPFDSAGTAGWCNGVVAGFGIRSGVVFRHKL